MFNEGEAKVKRYQSGNRIRKQRAGSREQGAGSSGSMEVIDQTRAAFVGRRRWAAVCVCECVCAVCSFVGWLVGLVAINQCTTNEDEQNNNNKILFSTLILVLVLVVSLFFFCRAIRHSEPRTKKNEELVSLSLALSRSRCASGIVLNADYAFYT